MTDQDKTDLEKNADPSAGEVTPTETSSPEPDAVELKVESVEDQDGVIEDQDGVVEVNDSIVEVKLESIAVEDGVVQVEEGTAGSSSFDVEGTIAEIKNQLEAQPDKFAPKRPPLNPVAVMMNLLAMMMFVGGTAVSFMLVARSFELHGNVLVAFVVVSAAVVLGMTGSFLCKILGDSERWLAGAVFGACLGAMSALIFYGQTRNYPWWQ